MAVWRALKLSLDRFSGCAASQAAAGMAYYALFSLFPLLVFMVAFASLFVQAEEAQRQVFDFVNQFVPVSRDLVIRNLAQVLALRGPISAIAALSLLWSASGFFAILGRNINCAWPEARSPSFLQHRLLALSMVGVLAALLMMLVIWNALLRVLSQVAHPLVETLPILQPLVRMLTTQVAPIVVSFCLFLLLYQRIPRARVRWRDAFLGAAFATGAWRLATSALVWYVGSGLVKYDLVYGSLGSLVALMFWMYTTSWVALFGAHLTASAATLARAARLARAQQPPSAV
ncbi:MAG: YihY/virulence factor BrkB family protein [Chloroflexi bacterium]|nr:YihY/virulence factor BrkB family protein [Chloroflexota bacterium]